MPLQRDYPLHEGYSAEDPGNRLRAALSEVTVADEPHQFLGELIYTASERGILDFSISPKDQATLMRLIQLAGTLDRAAIQKMRM